MKGKAMTIHTINTSDLTYDEDSAGQTTFRNQTGFSPGTSLINNPLKIVSQEGSSPSLGGHVMIKKGISFAPTSKKLLEKSNTISVPAKKEQSMFNRIDDSNRQNITDSRFNETIEN